MLSAWGQIAGSVDVRNYQDPWQGERKQLRGPARDKACFNTICLGKSEKTALYISKKLQELIVCSEKKCSFKLLTFYENCFINTHNLKKLIEFLLIPLSGFENRVILAL